MRGWYVFSLLALRIAGDELTFECVGGLYESNCVRTESGRLSRNPSSSPSAVSPADVAIEAWCVRLRSTRLLSRVARVCPRRSVDPQREMFRLNQITERPIAHMQLEFREQLIDSLHH